MPDHTSGKDTSSESYTVRLQTRSSVWWKKFLGVQARTAGIFVGCT